jgi:hypothetical protein
MSGPYLGSASFHGEQVSLQTYQPGSSQNGLLYQLTEAEPSRVHNYHYDAATGRLDTDTDPETHAITLDATTVDLASQTWHTALHTAQGRATQYDITSYYDGSLWRRVTGPDGFRTVQVDSVDGTLIVETPDGWRQSAHMTPDPRLGIMAQYPSTMSDALPSGLGRRAAA